MRNLWYGVSLAVGGFVKRQKTSFAKTRSETSRLARRNVLTASLALPVIMLQVYTAHAQTAPQDQDAWTIITSHPEFSDAVELFKYAGLVQYLQTDSFTAFIPTNAAFDRNPEVLPMLLKGRSRAFPDTTLAVQFIRAHAVYDQHPLSEFLGKTATLTSISGTPIGIDGSQAGSYTVTWASVQSRTATAHVVDKPLVASNALIYPVDTVVLTNP